MFTRSALHPLFRLGALAAAVTLAACGGSDDVPDTTDANGPLAAPAPSPAPAPGPAAPVLTSAPQPQTVGEGGTAEFSVAGTSDAGPLRFQWAVNGQGDIAGATDATLRFERVSLLDDGKPVFARLVNDAGSTTSGFVTLTVTERRWAEPLAPLGAGPGAADMAVAVDGNGVTQLAYTQRQANGSTLLHLAQKGPQSTLPESARSFGGMLPDGHTHHQLQLVPGPDGTTLLLWREGLSDSPGNRIKAALAHGPGGAELIEFGPISGLDATDAADAVAVQAGAEGFEIVFREHDGARWNVVARRLTLNDARNGGSFGPAVALESLAVDLGAPRLAGDAQGNLLVAFSSVTNASNSVERAYALARPATAGAWQSSELADVSGLDGGTPARVSALALDSQGRAILLMRSDQTRVYMRPYQFGGSTPGWQGGAQYVANRWDGLRQDVEPAIVVVGGATTRFSIISVHDNGRAISRWDCGADSCGALSGIVRVDTVVTDLRTGRDEAGNIVVAYSVADASDASRPFAVRHHAGLAAWRPVAAVGTLPLDGRLQLAVAPDGRATLLYPAQVGNDVVPRTSDFR
jgi:hypothetical protein